MNIRLNNQKNNLIIRKKNMLLALAKEYLPENPVILEAGAYKGQDSLHILKMFPHATMHLFEPVPELFKALNESIIDYPQAHTYNYALSDTNGTMPFYIAEKPNKPGIPTQAGSLLTPQERLKRSPIIYPKQISIPTITIDSWAQAYTIDRIDCMWLDVQGHELAVLRAAPHILMTTSVLFVELHFIQAYTNQPLADEVINWLAEQGFTMIAQDYENPPQWFFGNGLFVRQ